MASLVTELSCDDPEIVQSLSWDLPRVYCAKDFIWWADFRLQDDEKQRERREKTKATEGRHKKKKKLGDMKNPHLFSGGFSWPTLTMKLGKN